MGLWLLLGGNYGRQVACEEDRRRYAREAGFDRRTRWVPRAFTPAPLPVFCVTEKSVHDRATGKGVEPVRAVVSRGSEWNPSASLDRVSVSF